MARIGARKHGKFKAVSTAPSINKTPVGSSTPPLPYPVTHDLDNSVGVVPSVRLNQRPAYVLNQSTQPRCQGDAPGSCKGIKSGTVSGEVKPVQGSSTVRVGGKPIIRQGDPCTLNGGNCPGIYVGVDPTVMQPAATSITAALILRRGIFRKKVAKHAKRASRPASSRKGRLRKRGCKPEPQKYPSADQHGVEQAVVSAAAIDQTIEIVRWEL